MEELENRFEKTAEHTRNNNSEFPVEEILKVEEKSMIRLDHVVRARKADTFSFSVEESQQEFRVTFSGTVGSEGVLSFFRRRAILSL